MVDCVWKTVDASLRDWVVNPSLKQEVLYLLLLKSTLDPGALNNYRLVSNVPFLSMVAGQLQKM